VLMFALGAISSSPQSNEQHISDEELMREQRVLAQADSLEQEMDTIQNAHGDMQRILRAAMFMKDPQ